MTVPVPDAWDECGYCGHDYDDHVGGCRWPSEVRTAFHVGLWMHAHEEQHRQLDAMATGPLLDQGTTG